LWRLKDSTEVSTLKAEIAQDSVLFVKYQTLTANDSLQIVSLKKEVRKQKRQKVLIGIAAAIVAGFIIMK